MIHVTPHPSQYSRILRVIQSVTLAMVSLELLLSVISRPPPANIHISPNPIQPADALLYYQCLLKRTTSKHMRIGKQTCLATTMEMFCNQDFSSVIRLTYPSNSSEVSVFLGTPRLQLPIFLALI